MKYTSFPTLVFAGALSLGMIACERESTVDNPAAREPARDAGGAVREAGRDATAAAGSAADTMAGATETAAIKTALMGDAGVDASDINVDTDGTRKMVVLKGTVTTEAQRTRAEQIATREATGYRVDNQLTVRAR